MLCDSEWCFAYPLFRMSFCADLCHIMQADIYSPVIGGIWVRFPPLLRTFCESDRAPWIHPQVDLNNHTEVELDAGFLSSSPGQENKLQLEIVHPPPFLARCGRATANRTDLPTKGIASLAMVPYAPGLNETEMNASASRPPADCEEFPPANQTKSRRNGKDDNKKKSGRFHWDHHTIICLIECKRAFDKSRLAGGMMKKIMTRDEQWEAVAKLCCKKGMALSGDQAWLKWTRMWSAYQQIADWQRNKPDNKSSYWTMSPVERRKENFKCIHFDKEVFDSIEHYYGRDKSVNSTFLLDSCDPSSKGEEGVDTPKIMDKSSDPTFVIVDSCDPSSKVGQEGVITPSQEMDPKTLLPDSTPLRNMDSKTTLPESTALRIVDVKTTLPEPTPPMNVDTKVIVSDPLAVENVDPKTPLPEPTPLVTVDPKATLLDSTPPRLESTPLRTGDPKTALIESMPLRNMDPKYAPIDADSMSSSGVPRKSRKRKQEADVGLHDITSSLLKGMERAEEGRHRRHRETLQVMKSIATSMEIMAKAIDRLADKF